MIGLISFAAMAQDSASTEKPAMADMMRSNGKIYVVITCLVMILLGLVLYIIRVDGKISKLEKEQ
jgi:uncharacterized membrane protein